MAEEGDFMEGLTSYCPVSRNPGNSVFSLTPAIIFETGSPIPLARTVPIMSPKFPEGILAIIGSILSAILE